MTIIPEQQTEIERLFTRRVKMFCLFQDSFEKLVLLEHECHSFRFVSKVSLNTSEAVAMKSESWTKNSKNDLLTSPDKLADTGAGSFSFSICKEIIIK